jgi:DNA-binding XRE family transcriptional regulator
VGRVPGVGSTAGPFLCLYRYCRISVLTLQYICSKIPETIRPREDGLQTTSRLRELRDEASLSQEELAERAGVSRTTIADLELGKRTPHPKTRRKLAEALGVKPVELMDSETGQ